MMPFDEMHQFVDNDIFEALHRLLREFGVEALSRTWRSPLSSALGRDRGAGSTELSAKGKVQGAWSEEQMAKGREEARGKLPGFRRQRLICQRSIQLQKGVLSENDSLRGC
jgi:hypothetical protein